MCTVRPTVIGQWQNELKQTSNGQTPSLSKFTILQVRTVYNTVIKLNKIRYLIFFNAPHVLVDFVVLPPGHGRNETDF